MKALALVILTAAMLAACDGSSQPTIPTAVAPLSPVATETSAVTSTAGATPIGAAAPATSASTAPAAEAGTTSARPDDATLARLRVGQCVYNAPAVDVYIDGKSPVVAGIPLTHLGFGGTRYEYLAPGRHRVAIAPTGGSLDKPLLAPLDVEVVAAHRYTIAVLGQKDDTTYKALLIDETAALQAIGAKPTDLTDIAINNLKGAPGLDYTLSGVTRQSNVPYGGFQAAIWPSAWSDGDTVNVTGAPIMVVVKNGTFHYKRPGTNEMECWGGSFPGTLGTDYDSPGLFPESSDLNILDYLQGFTDESARNKGQTPSFKTFLAAIKSDGLADMLTKGDPYLVFAPQDSAFPQGPQPTRKAVRATAIANPTERDTVLRRYIVRGYYPAGTLVAGPAHDGADRTLTNILGEKLVLYGDPLTINGVEVGPVDSTATANGTRVFYDINDLALTDNK
jgi:hypothetical protein